MIKRESCFLLARIAMVIGTMHEVLPRNSLAKIVWMSITLPEYRYS